MANEIVAKLKSFPKHIPLPKLELSEERKKTVWIWILVLILGGAIIGTDVLLFHSASQTATTIDVYQTETVRELQTLLENLTKIDTAITSSQEMIGNSQEMITNSENSTNSSVEELATHLTTLHEDIFTTETDIQTMLNSISESELTSYEEYRTKFSTIEEQVATLDTTFQSIIEETQLKITELNSNSDSRTDTLITKLTTLQETLTSQEKSLNEDVLSTLSILKETLRTESKAQNTEVLNTLESFQEDSARQLTDVQEDLRGELGSRFDANSQAMNSQFTALSENTQTNLNLLSGSIAQENDELRAEIRSVYDYIDRSFTSVADGKQLVASALATKNVPVAEDATFQEIYTAILGIPQTVQAGSLSSGEVVHTYHHHTLGVRGDADSTDGATGAYGDTYHASTSGGCFTKPVYHVHTAACYHITHHVGEFEWSEYHSDTDAEGDEMGNWGVGSTVKCDDCDATTYHRESGKGSTGGGSTTVRWTSSTLICGKTEGTIEYYVKSCPLTEGQPVQSLITYYMY